MSETMTREERRDALDEFAKATAQPEGENRLPVPVNALQPAIVGAQIVAVRRNVRQVLVEIKELAAAAGTDWFYRFPVQNRRENRTDWIEGPSIKLAMSVMGIVGNIEVDTRVQDFGQSFMIYARAIDLEKGSAVTRAFQQSKSAAKIGGADSSRRDDMALQIGQSKAIRNAICALLETYTDFAFEEARNSLVDRIGSDLETWRKRTVEKVGARVDIKRVEAIIGRTSDKWLAPDVARIIAMAKSVEDGMASMDDTFPPVAAEAAPVDKALDQFADEPTDQEIAGAGSLTSPGEEPGAGSENPAPGVDQSVTLGLQRNAIDICLRLANNPQLTEAEKLEQLDNISPSLDGVPEGLLKTTIKTAAEVARGKMKAQDARRYLEGLVK